MANRSVELALALGCLLAGALLLGTDQIPSIFTHDTATIAAVSLVYPIMVASQPVNALAFVCDGILFGVKGFRFATPGRVLFCGEPFS